MTDSAIGPKTPIKIFEFMAHTFKKYFNMGMLPGRVMYWAVISQCPSYLNLMSRAHYYSLMSFYLKLSFITSHSLPPTRILRASEWKGFFFPTHNKARNGFLEEGALWGRAHIQRTPGKSHQGNRVKKAAMPNSTDLTILGKVWSGCADACLRDAGPVWGERL